MEIWEDGWLEWRKEQRRINNEIWKEEKRIDRARRKKATKERAANEKAERAIKRHQRRVLVRKKEGCLTVEEWNILKAQYEYRCPRCKKKEPAITLTIDHIIPVSKGGGNVLENIQPLCKSCNSIKHTQTIKF